MVAQVTLQQVAQELADAFTTKQRDNGSEFVTLIDAAQGTWIQDAVREAHDEALPNDSIYQMAKAVADEIAEELDSMPYFQYGDEVELHTRLDLLASQMSNYDLKKWLLDNTNADATIENAVANYYFDPKADEFDLYKLLMAGYYTQLDEIAGTLCRAMGEEYERRNKDAETE